METYSEHSSGFDVRTLYYTLIIGNRLILLCRVSSPVGSSSASSSPNELIHRKISASEAQVNNRWA